MSDQGIVQIRVQWYDPARAGVTLCMADLKILGFQIDLSQDRVLISASLSPAFRASINAGYI